MEIKYSLCFCNSITCFPANYVVHTVVLLCSLTIITQCKLSLTQPAYDLGAQTFPWVQVFSMCKQIDIKTSFYAHLVETEHTCLQTITQIAALGNGCP